MFVVIHRDRIIGRSTTLFGADAIRQQKRRGVLYQLLCVDGTETDRQSSDSSEIPEKTALSAAQKGAA